MTVDMDKELKRRARLITESELQQAIIDCVHAMGGVVAHFRPAKTAHGWRTAVAADGKGFPDLVICVNGRTLFRELKRMGMPLAEHQENWKRWLGWNGADWGLWRPMDWLDGTIEADLNGTLPGPDVEGRGLVPQ